MVSGTVALGLTACFRLNRRGLRTTRRNLCPKTPAAPPCAPGAASAAAEAAAAVAAAAVSPLSSAAAAAAASGGGAAAGFRGRPGPRLAGGPESASGAEALALACAAEGTPPGLDTSFAAPPPATEAEAAPLPTAPAPTRAGAGAAFAAARAQTSRCNFARRKARRQLPHFLLLYQAAVLFAAGVAGRLATQPAPLASRHMRKPETTSPLRTPGREGSTCCSGGSSPL
mmetsp:Transcript_34474/g.91685  ORF Transcript_34474/g.91685 Transcript_34474/m.91685 type:complete len:228 (+) Transcript_34474:1074-1757(+)